MNVVAKRGQLRLQSYVLNEGNIRCAERLRGRLNLDGYQLLRVPATGDTQQRNRDDDKGGNAEPLPVHRDSWDRAVDLNAHATGNRKFSQRPGKKQQY
jgi:hypothetical protein